MWHVYTKALFKPATLEEPMNSKAPTANQHPKSPPRLSAQVSFSTNRSHSLGGCISVSVCERQSGEIPRAMDGVCSSFNNAFKTHLMCFFQLYCTVQRSRVRMCATVSEPKQLGDREFNDDVIHRQILEPLHRQWITGQLTMTAANPRLDSDWLIANKTHLGGNVPNKQLCQSLTPKLWDRKGLNFIIRERRDTIFVEINANTFFFCYQICIIIWTTEMCEKSNQTKYSSISVSIIWQSDKRHTYEVTLIHSNECNWIHMPRHTHKKNHLYTVSSQPTLK